MADTKSSPQDQEILTYLTELQKVGLQITNAQGMIAWFKDRIAKGATLKEIKQKLKENNYDFKKVDTLLKERGTSKKALKKVEALETKIKTEERTKKEQSQLQLIITAFVIAAVGIMSAVLIGRTTADIDTSVLGETGGILTVFVKGGWILGIAGIFVGLFLVTMFISKKFKHKKLIKKKEEKTPNKKTTTKTPNKQEQKAI